MTAPQLALPFASRQERRFWTWYRLNPEVYQELERRALALHAKHPTLRFGVALLWEPMRYQALMTTGIGSS